MTDSDFCDSADLTFLGVEPDDTHKYTCNVCGQTILVHLIARGYRETHPNYNIYRHYKPGREPKPLPPWSAE